MNPTKRFRAVLEMHESSTATAITIPFDPEQVFNKRGRIPVKGTINGVVFRSSVFRMGDKPYFMVVNRKMREAGKLSAGETVSVVMERDDEPRTVTIPEDLKQALQANSKAINVWEKLSFTHQREYIEAIQEAKRPETRLRRIAKTVEQLIAKSKP